jgi:large subunit ribosomal protein L10
VDRQQSLPDAGNTQEGGEMVKEQSVATVAEIADKFRTSSAAVVTEYRGLTMKQLTQLRRALGSEAQYTVAKNTLVKRAAKDAGLADVDELFTGPTAIAFVTGEPSEAAKAIRDFAKANPLLVVKGGLLEGKPLKANEISKLAELESREVLLAKLAGAMKGNLAKAAGVLTQLPAQMARLMAALQEQKAASGEASAEPTTPEPAADEASAEPVSEPAADEAPNTEVQQAEAASTEAPAEG